MKQIPKFARKPVDKRGEVYPTERGWVVKIERTGKEELLWGIRDLDKKLAEIEKQLVDGVELQDAVEIQTSIDAEIATQEEKDKAKEEIIKPPKKSGKGSGKNTDKK